MPKNAVAQESKDAASARYHFREIGEYEQRAGEIVENIYKPDGRFCGRIANHVSDASLEWAQWD